MMPPSILSAEGKRYATFWDFWIGLGVSGFARGV
jgi:hypothetical protein